MAIVNADKLKISLQLIFKDKDAISNIKVSINFYEVIDLRSCF